MNKDKEKTKPLFSEEVSEKLSAEICLIRFFNRYGISFSESHLKDTPDRIERMYRDLLSSVGKDEPTNITVFDNVEGYDEMVISGNIPFYSLCSHHFLPFFGKAWIAYIPDEKIIGLSKLARVLEFYSKRPQVQEILVKQVADFIDKILEPKGVAVVIKARHLCTEMRGVRTMQEMTTSAVRGVFGDNEITRQEFLRLIENV